jgi:predicted glycosyltransferase involved in capsule biosynthesis
VVLTAPALSAVVPLRLGRRPRRGWLRLARLLDTLPAEITTVLVDDTGDATIAARTRDMVESRPGALYVAHPATAAGPFAIGRLRDAGAAAAPDGLVLFHDLDFAAPMVIYRKLLAEIARAGLDRDASAVRCVPVFFLTTLGTSVYRRAPERVYRILIRRKADRAHGLVDRLVLGSSAILVHRSQLLAIGGHDPGFAGHGAEDFELMHRLSRRHPLGPRPPRYHVNFGSRSASPDGFRAYFARYGRPLLDRDIALVHQWHPRRTDDPRYYAARRENFERLERVLLAGTDGSAGRASVEENTCVSTTTR